MMIGKLSLAAGLLIASSIGGVALGGYTIGGFRIHQPTDTLLKFETPPSAADAPHEMVTATSDTAHVCTGCDAKLHPDRDWERQYVAYQEPMPDADSGSYGGYDDGGDPVPASYSGAAVEAEAPAPAPAPAVFSQGQLASGY